MFEQGQLAIHHRSGNRTPPTNLIPFDIEGGEIGELPFVSEKPSQMFEHLLIPQPRPLVCLRIFHVAFAKFAEGNFHGPLVNAP